MLGHKVKLEMILLKGNAISLFIETEVVIINVSLEIQLNSIYVLRN